jgi:uncharacterized repeat protein (TIGR01451 family)
MKRVRLLITFTMLLAAMFILAATASETRAAVNPTGADVAIDGSAVLNPAPFNINYTIEVTNSGPEVAENVRMVDTLSRLTRIRSVQTTVGKCTGGAVVRCSLGKLAKGQTAVITINVFRPTSIRSTIINHPFVTTSTFDPNLANNDYVISVR